MRLSLSKEFWQKLMLGKADPCIKAETGKYLLKLDELVFESAKGVFIGKQNGTEVFRLNAPRGDTYTVVMELYLPVELET